MLAEHRRTVFGRSPKQAILIIVIVVGAAAIYMLLSLFLASESVTDRTSRNLRLVTSPDVVIQHFAGTSPESGGNYYERPNGNEIFVAIWKLPPLQDGARYEMWFLKSGKIYDNQHVRFDADGVARVGLEPVAPGTYDEITVTRETEDLTVPKGPVVLRWTRG